MPGQAWAFLAVACIAISSVSIKRGIQDTSLVAGLVVSLGAGSLATLPSVFGDISHPTLDSVLFFATAGLAGSLAGRGASIAGIDRLGASVAVSMEGTLYPLTAVVGDILFLHAVVNPTRLVGVGAIIVGIWLLSLSHKRSTLDETLRINEPRRSVSFTVKALFPVIAGVSFAASDLLRGKAVETWSRPIFGTFLGMFAAFVATTTFLILSSRWRARLRFGGGVRWFALQGFATSAATICAINALNELDVSAVSPILAAQPLPVLLLSLVFLREFEGIDRYAVGGAVAIVLGAGLVAI